MRGIVYALCIYMYYYIHVYMCTGKFTGKFKFVRWLCYVQTYM